MEGVVLVTDSMSLPGSVVTWALQTFQDKAGGGGQNLSVITQAALIEGKLQLKSSSLDVVVFVLENSGVDANEWAVELGRVAKPGGVVFLQTRSVSGNTEHTRAGLERSLLLAGFLGVEVANSVECWGSSDGLQPLTMKARKPTWETGSSFALKKRSATKTELDGIDMKIQLNDLEDLIDEDSLLSEEDLKKPELPAVGDCEVGATRKACKNCTCGRAEEERRGKLGLTSDQLNNPQSACGSCGLGDAFRCNGCPYKGLPPFKLGEKITLAGTLLTADV